VPVIYVPIINWPTPWYLRFRGGLCHNCTCAFTIEKFGDYFGSWYDMAGDKLRAMKKPAVNPFPDDPNFKWEEFIINPNWEPAPIEQCVLKFWKPETLAAKGASQKIW